jgi:RNA polymerase sigma-70 factor (ECF subfamily)
MASSPVIRLNRAVALRYVAGPTAALSEVEALAHDLEGYHLFHSIRGAFLLELGRSEQARAAEMRALALTGNRAEQLLIHQRLSARGLGENGLHMDRDPLSSEGKEADDTGTPHQR